MNHIRRIALFALLAVSALLFAGCSSGQQAEMVSPAAYERAQFAVMEEASAADLAQPGMERRIVSTVDLALIIADTDAALTAINRLADESGGYITATNLYQTGRDGGQLEGSLTLRVPSEHLQATLDQLSALAVTVESQNMNRQDVTDQYVDLHAQLRNLEATEEELRALLTEVRSRPDAEASDILAVHQSMTQIRGEIERVQGRINLLDNTTAFATIHIFLRVDVAALPIVEEGWRPGATLTEALRALTATMQRLGNLVIWWAVYLAPITLILATPIVMGFFVARWFLRRRRVGRGAAEAV